MFFDRTEPNRNVSYRLRKSFKDISQRPSFSSKRRKRLHQGRIVRELSLLSPEARRQAGRWSSNPWVKDRSVRPCRALASHNEWRWSNGHVPEDVCQLWSDGVDLLFAPSSVALVSTSFLLLLVRHLLLEAMHLFLVAFGNCQDVASPLPAHACPFVSRTPTLGRETPL